LLAGFGWTYFFDPEDRGDMFLRKVSWNSSDYTASYPRRWYSFVITPVKTSNHTQYVGLFPSLPSLTDPSSLTPLPLTQVSRLQSRTIYHKLLRLQFKLDFLRCSEGNQQHQWRFTSRKNRLIRLADSGGRPVPDAQVDQIRVTFVCRPGRSTRHVDQQLNMPHWTITLIFSNHFMWSFFNKIHRLL
jgi:hypothetical protein